MFEQEIRSLQQKGLFRNPWKIESASSSRILIEGKTLINLSSNNYLGLTTHPRVKEAVALALQKYGVGSGASPLISGHTQAHEELARKVAQFKGTEAALIFSTGYMANAGILSALLGRGDLVFVDRLCHASIIDGCRLSKAKLQVFPHKDVGVLARRLARTPAGGRILIATDGVFSMDGDLAPLPEIASVARKSGAMVMVDDAHAIGVLGATGRGTVEHYGLEDQIAVQMGTLSKAVGVFGAYVAGSRDLITYLTNRSRSYIYSTSLPAALAAASRAALEVLEQEPQHREQLWKNREYYARGVRSIGFDTLQSETPIIPLLIGESGLAQKMSQGLFARGIFAPAIRPPTVPEGMARIRTSIMATHTREDLDYSLEALEKVGRQFKVL